MAIVAAMAVLVIFMKNEYGSIFSGDTYGIPAVIEKGEIDHLFLGSSMFRLGLDIDVLEENLDGNVYILSYNGNQPTFIAQELAYLLEHKVKIKNLYVDFYAFSAASVPRIYDERIFLDTDLKFKMDVWKKLKDNAGWLTFYEMFVTANNEQILTYSIHNKIASADFRNGGSLTYMEGRTIEELQEMERNGITKVNKIQAQGYREIYDLAQEHNINLLFLETPKYKKIREEVGKECYNVTLEDMKRIADDIGITYVLSDEVGFNHEDSECFNDLIHLSSKGKKVYTEKLCVYLIHRSSF